MAALIEVSGEYEGVFIDRPVLNGGGVIGFYLGELPEAAVEKIYLKMKRPPVHIFIKILEIRVFIDRLVQGIPAVMPGELLR